MTSRWRALAFVLVLAAAVPIFLGAGGSVDPPGGHASSAQNDETGTAATVMGRLHSSGRAVLVPSRDLRPNQLARFNAEVAALLVAIVVTVAATTRSRREDHATPIASRVASSAISRRGPPRVA